MNSFAGWLAVGLLAAIASGLLIAAAVVGLANVVGTGGALGIVGGLFAVLALTIALVLQQGRRRSILHRDSDAKWGEIAAGFLVGLWDGFSKPRPRGPGDDAS